MKLLELFKGTGSVGKVAQKLGFDIVSLDLEPYYTPDIETDILEWDYKRFFKESKYVPDMIWASPPCNTFSPLVYRLKERDTKTAEPFSDRAKLGTKILYKTLEIIAYFKKKNPNLLFVIENPRGMMRMDKKMMKLAKETTLYCLYGDFKRKPTDFFNNFPEGLGLKVDTQCPDNIEIKGVQRLPLNERYKIPSKLVRQILLEFMKQYKTKLGKGSAASSARYNQWRRQQQLLQRTDPYRLLALMMEVKDLYSKLNMTPSQLFRDVYFELNQYKPQASNPYYDIFNSSEIQPEQKYVELYSYIKTLPEEQVRIIRNNIFTNVYDNWRVYYNSLYRDYH